MTSTLFGREVIVVGKNFTAMNTKGETIVEVAGAEELEFNDDVFFVVESSLSKKDVYYLDKTGKRLF